MTVDTIKLLERNAELIDRYFAASPGTDAKREAARMLRNLAVTNRRAAETLQQAAEAQAAGIEAPAPVNWPALRAGLYRWRTTARLSLRKAAEIVGVKHSTLHRIEKGKRVRADDYGRVAATVFSQRTQ